MEDETSAETPVERAMQAGKWVPIHFGSRFKLCRLGNDRRRTQEESAERFPNLGAAAAECDRRNAGAR